MDADRRGVVLLVLRAGGCGQPIMAGTPREQVAKPNLCPIVVAHSSAFSDGNARRVSFANIFRGDVSFHNP